MTTLIESFTPHFDQALIDISIDKLRKTRYPEAETVEDWSQGLPLAYAQELVRYWQDEYDWTRVPRLLRSYDNHLTNIDGIDIHLLHIRSKHTKAIPLLLTHGWPGSVLEFLDIIPRLVDPTNWGGSVAEAFHLVIPSLPGFGFSGKPTCTGTTTQRIAEMWDELMQRVGYNTYLAQGGDWGSVITHALLTNPETNCLAGHVNLPLVMPDDIAINSKDPEEQNTLLRAMAYQEHESGYSKQQSTRPQTLAYGLADSPVGQLAWIIEKYAQWTDCEVHGIKHPENTVSRDQLLDIVTHFWMTNTAGSSGRLYWESFDDPDTTPVTKPIGVSQFPKEIFQCSERLAKTRYKNLVFFSTDHAKGGHFASLEQPEELIKDVRSWVKALRSHQIL